MRDANPVQALSHALGENVLHSCTFSLARHPPRSPVPCMYADKWMLFLQCALSRTDVTIIAQEHPIFGTAMANIVRIFKKKLNAKNPQIDLEQVVANLLDSHQRDDEDDEYVHKVHLSDVMREIKLQVSAAVLVLLCTRLFGLSLTSAHLSPR